MKIDLQPMLIEKAASPAPKAKASGFASLLHADQRRQSNSDAEGRAGDSPSIEAEQTEMTRENLRGEVISEESSAQPDDQDDGQDETNDETAVTVEVSADDELPETFDQSLTATVNEDVATLALPVAAMPTELINVTPTQSKETPLISDWSQAFGAQVIDNSDPLPETLLAESKNLSAVDSAANPDLLLGGAIKLPQGFVPVAVEAQIPLDLAAAKALDQLTDLVALQIKASTSPAGAKRLTLLLSPEGLGRMRILAESDQGRMRVQLQVEKGDAARMIEQLLPQLEAQIAASTSMPVEFELIQEELFSDDNEMTDRSLEEQSEERDSDSQSTDADLVEEWNQAFEEPALERGQTLHVVA
jgi:hypothetical protein